MVTWIPSIPQMFAYIPAPWILWDMFSEASMTRALAKLWLKVGKAPTLVAWFDFLPKLPNIFSGKVVPPRQKMSLFIYVYINYNIDYVFCYKYVIKAHIKIY